MTDDALLEEFARLLKSLIEDFELEAQQFRRKLKVSRKNVNRWTCHIYWPNFDNWRDYKSTALGFVPKPKRTSLKETFAQMDELIRRKNAMKPARASSSVRQFAHADRDVVFWRSFRDRDADGNGVGNLISNAKKCIIVSGVTPHQLVHRFEEDIRGALKGNVLVGIIRSRLTPDLCRLYEPYARVDPTALSTTAELYIKLYNKLSESQKEYFGFFETDILLTHSIGLYDKRVFLSEFIMHQHSEHCPSCLLPYASCTCNQLLSELLALLESARVLFGGAKDSLLAIVKSYLGQNAHL
jgi:hypothetical protein